MLARQINSTFKRHLSWRLNSKLGNYSQKKATPYGRVPAKLLKLKSDICSEYLTSFFNNMVESCEFPDERKEGETISLFKNQDAMAKKNNQLITILTSECKIFEQIMYDQIKVFRSFSHYLFGYNEGSSSQHALLRVLET